jgi:hypothetical protein
MCLVRLGFPLTEFSEQDLDLLDADGDHNISVQEYCDFFKVMEKLKLKLKFKLKLKLSSSSVVIMYIVYSRRL